MKARLNYKDGTTKIINIPYKVYYIKVISKDAVISLNSIPQIIPYDTFKILNSSNKVEPTDYVEVLYFCSRCGVEISQEEYKRDMSLCKQCEEDVDKEEEVSRDYV